MAAHSRTLLVSAWHHSAAPVVWYVHPEGEACYRVVCFQPTSNKLQNTCRDGACSDILHNDCPGRHTQHLHHAGCSFVDIVLQPCSFLCWPGTNCAAERSPTEDWSNSLKVVTFHGSKRMRLRWDRVNSTVIVVLSIFAFEYFTCVACVVSLCICIAPAASAAADCLLISATRPFSIRQTGLLHADYSLAELLSSRCNQSTGADVDQPQRPELLPFLRAGGRRLRAGGVHT